MGHLEQPGQSVKLVRLRPRQRPRAREAERLARDRIGKREGLGQELQRAAVVVGVFRLVHGINLVVADRDTERGAVRPKLVFAAGDGGESVARPRAARLEQGEARLGVGRAGDVAHLHEALGVFFESAAVHERQGQLGARGRFAPLPTRPSCLSQLDTRHAHGCGSYSA